MALVFLFLMAAATASAQLEPCGYYEIDGRPGYGSRDIAYTASFWRQSGSYPDVPDYNGDGVVNMSDMVAQASCVSGLAPGLVGSYYGLDDGDPDQVITFPDFSTITFEPTVVQAIDRFEDFGDNTGFLNTDMRDSFGAVFNGYIRIPETAHYIWQISGSEGMRVYLEDIQVMSFDGGSSFDEYRKTYAAGLLPIRIEYYSNSRNNSASLTWSSNGSVISSVNQTVEPDYLYHESAVVPEHAVREVQVIFDPPSGTRLDDHPRLQAWVLAPNGNVSLEFDGRDRILYDGKMDEDINLGGIGLRKLPYTATDEDGNTFSGIYNAYYDRESADATGLITNIRVAEWYEGPIPGNEGETITTKNYGGTQFVRDGNDELFIGSHYIGEKTLVDAVGVMGTSQTGIHGFRIEGYGALYIDGEQVCARGFDFPDQYRVSGEKDLTPGRHHYQLRMGLPTVSPECRVFWTLPGRSEEEIPASAFLWDRAHQDKAPVFSGSTSTNGRVRPELVAEYIFAQNRPWRDTSGNGYHLMPDTRAIIRDPGGITYSGGGATASTDVGIHLVSRAKNGGEISMEVDFVKGPLVFSEERLSTLQSNTQLMVNISSNHNDLRFDFYDEDRNLTRAEAPNILVEGQRYHVIGTYDDTFLRLYVNGVRIASINFAPEVQRWPSFATFSVGQNFFRYNGPGVSGQGFHGTILTAAAYVSALSLTQVNTNMNANLGINPVPGPVNYPAAPEFPPPGTSQAELDEAHHILNRLAFGASPQDLNTVLNMGVSNWIAEQMDPDSIDDSDMEETAASQMFLPDSFYRDLGGWMTFRMVHSKRQLLEVMTWFWENHFSTMREKVDYLAEELAENHRFRDNALGHFGDLLGASAMNYPMTVYLDSDSNIVGAPNENYGREILELHTYGVDNGYTQEDIVQAARCFTGWTVNEGKFHFNPGLHDYGEKTLLGITIPAGGGFSDGVTLIDHITKSPRTSEFISFKLCQLFIADDPPADVQTAVATTFNNTCGDISATLTTLLNHARFRTDLAYRNNKTKTPLEFAVSMLRATETAVVGNALTHYLENMAMDLFNYGDPTGFSEEAVDWVDTNALNLRWELVNTLSTNRRNATTPALDIYNLAGRYQFSDYVGILDFLENITTHGQENAAVRALAEAWLTDGDPGGFSLDEATLDGRVRQTLGFYLRLPEFNKQ